MTTTFNHRDTETRTRERDTGKTVVVVGRLIER